MRKRMVKPGPVALQEAHEVRVRKSSGANIITEDHRVSFLRDRRFAIMIKSGHTANPWLLTGVWAVIGSGRDQRIEQY